MNLQIEYSVYNLSDIEVRIIRPRDTNTYYILTRTREAVAASAMQIQIKVVSVGCSDFYMGADHKKFMAGRRDFTKNAIVQTERACHHNGQPS